MMASFLTSWWRPAAKARPALLHPDNASAQGSSGVYVSLPELLALEHRLRQWPGRVWPVPSHSLLAGQHRAGMRGRGLDFEELREYRPGDDPRAIDWRVTARRGVAHVRVYNEERDRCHWLIVDQRRSMFFGRRRALRSVVAAQAAALMAWKALHEGDRIAGVVFGDEGCDEIPPRRGRRSLLQLLSRIVERNQCLQAGPSAAAAEGQLNEALARLNAQAPRKGRVTVMSDFCGFTERTRTLLADLARFNEVLLLPLWEAPGPTLNTRRVVSDGVLQIEVDMSDKQVRERLAGIVASRQQTLLGLREQLGLAVLPLVTDEDVVVQLAQLFGAHRQ